MKPEQPESFNYDTYCGLYCGACSIMIAYRTGIKDPFASYWTESALKAVLHARGIEVEDQTSLQLRCHGCKTDDRFINCRDCRIRVCAIEKRVEHCNRCDNSPCDLFSGLILNEKFQNLLPHLKEAPENLAKIQRDGTETWLACQKEKYRCPECGTAFSWYTNRCTHCGRELDTKFPFRCPGMEEDSP